MRVFVRGSYNSQGEYEWRFADGANEGAVYMVIAGWATLRIGNSYGGWVAKPVTYAGQRMLSLVHLSGSERRLDQKEVRRIARGRRGYLLRSGLTGLWAKTSGSARVGLLHPYTPSQDEIEAALDKGRYGRRVLRRVDQINLVSDDTPDEYDWPTVVADGMRTYGDVDGRQVAYVRGGTLAIFCRQKGFLDQSGFGRHFRRYLREVFVTPEADKALVSRLIAAANQELDDAGKASLRAAKEVAWGKPLPSGQPEWVGRKPATVPANSDDEEIVIEDDEEIVIEAD
ncbi:MAG: hypothetical protein WC645_08300 [Candidatus Margulisiibacteriota bacterium]